jgi:hypothetical protein
MELQEKNPTLYRLASSLICKDPSPSLVRIGSQYISLFISHSIDISTTAGQEFLGIICMTKVSQREEDGEKSLL